MIEVEITGVRIINLQKLPSPLSYNQILVGNDGKLAIMVTDGRQANLLIMIEPNLISELLSQSGRDIGHTTIEALKQLWAFPRIVIPKEKKAPRFIQQAACPSSFFCNLNTATVFSPDNSKIKAISSSGQLLSETLTDEESYNQLLSTLPNRTIENFKIALQNKNTDDQRHISMSP